MREAETGYLVTKEQVDQLKGEIKYLRRVQESFNIIQGSIYRAVRIGDLEKQVLADLGVLLEAWKEL